MVVTRRGSPQDRLDARVDWLRILQLHPDGVVILDQDGRCTFANVAALRILGVRRDELERRGLDHPEWNARRLNGSPLGPDDAAPAAALRGRRVVLGAEAIFDRPDGSAVVLAINAAPLPGEAGVAGAIVSFRDVTQRRRTERRERLLIEAGATLAGSLDYEDTLARVARAAVPVFADFCVVDVVEPTGEIRRVGIAATEPRIEGALLELAERFPPRWDSALPASVALREAHVLMVERLDPDWLAGLVDDERHARLLRDLHATSLLAAPLLVRDRRVGAITFGFADSRRHYDQEDRRLAEEIARRAALAIENARLYERAETSSRAKSDFIGVMSHEFRTPLTAIVGYADLLETGVSGPLSDTQRTHVERIKASAWHLTQLVDEVLTFSRIEAGQEKVAREPIEPGRVAQRVAGMVEPVAQARGLELHTELMATGRRNTDPHKLRQILINLLANAVKFTERGAVTLRLTGDADGFDFEVCDTGVGIAAEHLDHIFEPFWQVEQGTTRTCTGTGLGLTVSRRLARLLGGDLVVRSEPGHGSVFRLHLPAPPID